MKTSAIRYVDVKDEVRMKLCGAFGCSERMVMDALTYRSDSELARKIRWTAVKEFGGRPMAHCPECETMHVLDVPAVDGGERLFALRQWFDNGARLEADRETGTVRVWDRHDCERGRWECVSLDGLARIQMFAATL